MTARKITKTKNRKKPQSEKGKAEKNTPHSSRRVDEERKTAKPTKSGLSKERNIKKLTEKADTAKSKKNLSVRGSNRNIALKKNTKKAILHFASFPQLNPNPVLEVNAAGKIVFYNNAAQAVLDQLGKDVSVFLPEDIEEILNASSQGRKNQFLRRLHMDDKIFEEAIHYAPQFNSLRIYAVDITERTKTESVLRESEAKYRSLFANMISGFAYHQIVLNKKGKPVDYIFLEINDAFESMTGLTKAGVVGKNVTEIIPGIKNDPADWIGTYGKVALTGKEITFENYSEALKKWFSVAAYSPQKGYFVSVFDDITDRKRAEEALRDANERYELILSGAEAGIWDWDVLRHKVMFSKRWKTMRGFAEDEVSDAEEEWSRRIHPEDAPRVMAAVQAHFKGKTPFFAEEYRVRCKDGSWIWIADRGIVQRDAHGNVIRMAGSESDITKRKIAEEALRTSETRYRELVQNANSAIIRWSRNGTITFFNEYAQDFFGWSADEVIGKHVGFLVPEHESTGADLTGLAQDIVEHPDRYVNNVNENVCRDGRRVWMAWTNRATFDEKGQVTEILAVGSDITERKRFEEKLQKAKEELESRVQERTEELRKTHESVESERQRLYSVLDKLPAYVCLLNADYKFVYVNQTFKRLFGDPGNRQCFEYLFGLQKPCEGCQTFRIFGENLHAHHWEWVGPNGSTYSVSDYPFTDIDGAPLILEMGIDITEQKQAAKAIKESEHKYHMLVEQAADGIVILDQGLKILDVNTAACSMTGFDREELLGRNALELYRPGELEEQPLRLDEVLSGKTATLERMATKKDGSLIEVEISAKLTEGRQIQAIVRDITERKSEERRNHLATDLLELFAKKTTRKEYLDAVVTLLHNWTGCRSVGIRVTNKEGYMPYASHTGFSAEFMRKENMISIDSDTCACCRVITGKFEPQDAPALTPKGSFRLDDSIRFVNQLTETEMTRFRGQCIRSGYTSIAVIPIRYRNQALGAIHIADERHNMMPLVSVQFLESMAAPLIGEAIYRFSAEEELIAHHDLLDKMVKDRTQELHDIQADLNRAQTVAHTGSWRLDVRKNELLWSDENWRIFGVPRGTQLTYETFISTVHPEDREYVDRMWKAALTGEPYDIEHRIVVGNQVKWVREKAELEFDKNGALKGGFGTTQDITERKQAEKELQTLLEELKRSNTDLEQFAYAASHDLQEPLRVVAGFVSLLEKRYKDKLDDKAHEFIEYAVDGVKRMQALIKDLLAYSQVGTKGKTFRPAICAVALEQAIYNLHTAIEESGAELTYDPLPTVSADVSQLTRLFQNLIGNAIKFRGKKQLKVHISAEKREDEWVFSIRDNGIGIDPKFFNRIFVVFQRLHTREEYEGTGIGLAVCKKIVERHGGQMWVESEQGKGTTFFFTLPVME